MIFTASFFEEQNWGAGRLVSIALTKPIVMQAYIHRDVMENELLMPTWHLVNSYRSGNKHPDRYTEIYRDIIKDRVREHWFALFNGNLDPDGALGLLGLNDGDTLLCWEKFGMFCHRIVVADLLTLNGVQVHRK